MPRAKVLPVPARPTTTATPWPPWHRSWTIACWSWPAVGWAARVSRTALWEATAACSPVAGGGRDEPLLDGEQLGGGPAAFLQSPVGDPADRPLGQEPVGQLLQLRPSSPGPPARPAPRAT